MNTKPIFLSIGGSDPGGGAGIQADIKTSDRLGTYPCSVVTSVTAQNSQTVEGVWEIEPERIGIQLKCVLKDLKPAAAKVGLVCSGEAVKVIADILSEYEVPNIVVDPILSPTLSNGSPDEGLMEAMVNYLFPLAELVTPNIPEKESFEKFMGLPFENLCNSFLLKGGHAKGDECVDILFLRDREGQVFSLPSTAFPTLNFNHSSLFNHDSILPEPDEFIPVLKTEEIRHRRISTQNTHGSGCLLSAAIACELAWGEHLAKAVRTGCRFAYNAIKHSANIRLTVGNYGPSLI